MIILETPTLVILYLLALLLLIADIKLRTGFLLPVLSAVVALFAIVYSFVLGASMQEVLIIVLIFLFLNLTVYGKGGQK